MLKITDLKVSYGGINAVKGVSFEVPKGSVVSLIGANGAGKSTILRTIAGLVKPVAGTVSFNDENITGTDTSNIIAKGITLVPEGRRVFPDMTVLDNIKIGAFLRHDSLDKDIEHMYSLFPRLKERKWQLAGTLSGGEQQMLALARALMSKPKLLMMDEPSLGLAPLIVKGIFEIIKEINKSGVTVLLIEQNANMALKASDYAYVLETGRLSMEGSGEELLSNESIREAYLGKNSNKKNVIKNIKGMAWDLLHFRMKQSYLIENQKNIIKLPIIITADKGMSSIIEINKMRFFSFYKENENIDSVVIYENNVISYLEELKSNNKVSSDKILEIFSQLYDKENITKRIRKRDAVNYKILFDEILNNVL